MHTVKITPLSDHPPAIEATKRTLAALVPWPVVNMAADLDEEGRIVGESSNPRFVRFVCERQGYAKRVDFDFAEPEPAEESDASALLSARTVVITGNNHPLDPPIGTELAVIRHARERVVIVGWDSNASEPSPGGRWPMLHEHVQPSEGQP